MSSRSLRFAAGLGLLLGCEPSPPPAVGPVPVPPPPSCETRLVAFAQRLDAMPTAGAPISVPEDLLRAVAVVPRGQPLVEQRGSLLVVGTTVEADGQTLAGDDEARAEALVAHLRTTAENAAVLGADPPRTLYVVAPATETIARIRRLVAPLAGMEVRLVGRPATVAPLPRPERVPPHIEALLSPSATPVDPSLRAMQIAQATTAAVGSCTPLAEAFRSLAAAPPEARAPLMKRAMIRGLRACRCEGADVDALEALLLAILAPAKPLVWLPMPAEATGTVGEAIGGQ